MAAPTNTATQVLERVQADIDLSKGLDESMPEESIPWETTLSNVENLVNSPESMSLRPGAPTLATTDSAATTLAPIFRLASTQQGMGLVGNSYQLYHLTETTQQLINKGRMPEFSHRRIQVGSTGEVTTITGVAGVAILTNYYAIAYMGETQSAGSTVSTLTIDILGKTSHNVVTSLVYTSTLLHNFTMVGVDSRYLHIYQSKSGGSTVPRMFVIDTNALPSNPVLSPAFTNFTGGAAGDYVMGVVAVTGASVAIITSSASNNRIEKFNNTPASAANAAIAGYTTLSGLDTDGTNFYVAGRLMSLTSPATLTLTTWLRASFSASPWAGVASAGTSGTNSYSEATNPPSVGTAVNGLNPALFDATNDKLSGGGMNATNGTIILLVKPNSTGKQLLAFVDGINNNTLLLNYSATTGYVFSSSGVVGSGSVSYAWPVNQYAMVAIKWTGASSNFKMKVNSSDWTQAAMVTSAANHNVTIGITGATPADCSILEFMVATTELTDGQVEDVREYLNARYALSM